MQVHRTGVKLHRKKKGGSQSEISYASYLLTRPGNVIITIFNILRDWESGCSLPHLILQVLLT